jgi:15-cis-phytoene desaturase
VTGTVLVLGGGVGGMSAAHELAERGFSVTVIEDRGVPGGKARSIPVPDTGRDGRRDLPAEHGFRFFPGFYRHLPDTMRRIPFGGQPDGVFGNLRQATEAEIARQGGKVPLLLPARFPHSISDVTEIIKDVTRGDLGLTVGDTIHFWQRLLVLLTSCEARRFGEWEQQSWWDFSGASSRSEAYQRFLADGLTRTLVAARAREMSARTGGSILLQLLFDIGVPGRSADRLLNGPTNDVWIDPWVDHLRTLGVDLRFGTRAQAIDCSAGRITSVTAREPDGRTVELHADWYVAALPVEHMARLTTPAIKEADPTLDSLGRLRTRWMNGIVFFLRRDVPVVHGHVIYIDSAWSLTSISQGQFWDQRLDGFGAGDVGGVLSVDVSDWTTPGPVTGKPAMQCSHTEIFTEVWAQLQAHLNSPGATVLEDSNLVRWFLDTDVRFPEVHQEHGVREDINLEPLLVNTVGSWAWRPEAGTAIENLVLASDYVRTYTDLATMEGANEAARRAVNAILDRSGSTEPKCRVWPLHEPAIFAPARLLDQLRYQLGQRHRPAPGQLPAPDSS